MAGKTPTELNDLIARLRTELEVLSTELSLLKADLERAEIPQLRERLAVVDNLAGELRRKVEDLDRRAERLAVLEAQFAELKKQFEEKDRRWWQFWVGVSAVGLTFVANLVINLLLFFARKPG